MSRLQPQWFSKTKQLLHCSHQIESRRPVSQQFSENKPGSSRANDGFGALLDAALSESSRQGRCDMRHRRFSHKVLLNGGQAVSCTQGLEQAPVGKFSVVPGRTHINEPRLGTAVISAGTVFGPVAATNEVRVCQPMNKSGGCKAGVHVRQRMHQGVVISKNACPGVDLARLAIREQGLGWQSISKRRIGAADSAMQLDADQLVGRIQGFDVVMPRVERIRQMRVRGEARINKTGGGVANPVFFNQQVEIAHDAPGRLPRVPVADRSAFKQDGRDATPAECLDDLLQGCSLTGFDKRLPNRCGLQLLDRGLWSTEIALAKRFGADHRQPESTEVLGLRFVNVTGERGDFADHDGTDQLAYHGQGRVNFN